MTLNEIAKKMCAKGKGILAADESTGTIGKRFKSINVESTEENRLLFRQTLFSSEAMKNYIGGVILYDETIRQKTSINMSIAELILKNDSLPGIKVDKGAKPLAGSKKETIYQGGSSGSGVGSNCWVIHGDYTESGKPLLACDPHLMNVVQSMWYGVRIAWKDT